MHSDLETERCRRPLTMYKETTMTEKKEKSFEESMARLEEIVRALESGTAALDDSLGLFEEGISLVKLCNAKLEGAEQKVKLLVKGEDGTLSETDFTGGGR